MLLLSWQDDSLGVATEVSELQNVFSHVYRFSTRSWRIPSTGSHNRLAQEMIGFISDHDTDESLLIVYYGGHGGMDDERRCIWSWQVSVLLDQL